MHSSTHCYSIFERGIHDYHIHDHVDTPMRDPYPDGSFESLLYQKNWNDTVQWHLEDLIRDPNIDPVEALQLKRRIDKANQVRTDIVEKIDDFFMEAFRNTPLQPHPRLNSETPAWLLDRKSILLLKIYHMEEQVNRKDVDDRHIVQCKAKLAVLTEQREDMRQCYDELMDDLKKGVRKMKVYRQMKMYNDASLNPILYGTKK